MIETKLKKAGEICFWIGLVIEILIVIIDKSAYINPYEGWLFRITFVLFGIKVMTTKYTMKEWLCILGVGIVAAISYFVNEKDEVVRIVVFVAACKDLPLKNILKTTLFVTAAGSVVLFLLSVTGIFGALTMTANFGRGPFPGIVETRYCFGMGHPNAFQCMMFMMTVLCLYTYAKEMKWYHFVLLFAVNFLVYQFTDSNTSLLVTVAAICGVAVMKYWKWLQKSSFAYWAGTLLVLGIVIFSAIGSHYGRTTQFMWDLDQLLNGRFQYAHVVEASRLENWKLFAAPENTEFFDAGFIKLFYWYGIIPGCLYVFANLYLIYQSYKKQDYALLVIVVAFTVFSIMEAHLISWYILRNYLFIVLGYYWYQPFVKMQETEANFWQIKKLLGKA